MFINNTIFIDIVSEQIDLAVGYKFVSNKQQGAITNFIGMVRAYNLGKQVLAVSYDVHKELAIEIIYNICQDNVRNYGEIFRQYVVHFHGKLAVGAASVAIFVSSPHRREAFVACQHIIESIKHRAPIWKQEHYVDGNSTWVQGHALCQH